MRRLQDFTVSSDLAAAQLLCAVQQLRAGISVAVFSITLFYYNPNIYPPTEYEHRVEEQQRLIHSLPAVHPISFCPGPYDSDRFYELTRGMENVPEGGERCFVCYEIRLREAAEMAKQLKLDYFTTTLSISPLKKRGKAE